MQGGIIPLHGRIKRVVLTGTKREGESSQHMKMQRKILEKIFRVVKQPVLVIALFSAVFNLHAVAAQPARADAAEAAMKMVNFTVDAKAELDMQAAAELVDYVLAKKPYSQSALPKNLEASGAYYEFDTRIDFSSFMQYAYSGQIPAVLTSPSSLRHSQWNAQKKKHEKLPDKWTPVAAGGRPFVIRGVQRDAITPDLNTGIYYEYDLNRALIQMNHKGRQVLITISKQMDISQVGKKGLILGNDEDWNYYYSDETGSAKTGLGWVKSYIYDYFSVAVYVETGSSPAVLKTGIFQWLRAGWNGINFVQSDHIITGIKRYAKNSKTVLESSDLPAPAHIARAYSRLSSLPHQDLLDKYTQLQQARLELAVQTGKINGGKLQKNNYQSVPKDQIVEELMLEYLKVALGKPSLVGRKVASAIN